MERMYTQALSIYLLSVNWWWERRFLRSCLMLRVWQLFLLFPSVVVLVDALKCLNYDLTKKKVFQALSLTTHAGASVCS